MFAVSLGKHAKSRHIKRRFGVYSVSLLDVHVYFSENSLHFSSAGELIFHMLSVD